uniref:VapE domain-containing protein n=1 Tax=unclassified Acinetobacter TaxID=196816 RepID=UPI0015D26177
HGFPHLSEKGKPLNTWENLSYLLDQYGIRVRYNVISKKTEVLIPGHASSIDNKQKATLAEITSLCARNGMPKTEIAQYLVIIGDRNQYNPVLTWVNSQKWDGVSRFSDLANTITPDDNYSPEMRDILLKRWLISAIAAAANTGGFESHGALVLVGAQGTGKTTWFNRLVCPELRRELVLTGALLDTENKDTIITAVSHWICELGELDATFRKADIAKLKAFITQGVDKFRRPFEREDDERDRRTIFCASVNQSDYLVDDTGNRRWWTIPAKNIDYMHEVNMQQLWAEVYEWYKAGERWYLSTDEQAQLKAINESHEQIDPIAEKIRQACTAPEAKLKSADWMIAGEVLEALGYRTPNKTQRNIAAKALQDLGVECRLRHKVKQYLVPGGLKSKSYDPDQDRPF